MRNLAQMVVTFFLCTLASTAFLICGVEAYPSKVRHYDRFASTLPDTGACGNNWAPEVPSDDVKGWRSIRTDENFARKGFGDK